MSGVSQTYIAQLAQSEVKKRTGVTVPLSAFLAHFAEEGTGGTNGYNLAGLKPGGHVAYYSTPSQFLAEYVPTVSNDIKGGQKQGFTPTSGTLTQTQFAQALQYGGGPGLAYCAGGCGGFYAVPNPTVAPGLPAGTTGVNLRLAGPGGNPQNPILQTPQQYQAAGAAQTAAQNSFVSGITSWLSGSGGLLILFGVMTIVVFIFAMKGQVGDALKNVKIVPV